jgi:hypothetical protein
MALNRAEAEVRRMSETRAESLVCKSVFVMMSVRDRRTQRDASRIAHGRTARSQVRGGAI